MNVDGIARMPTAKIISAESLSLPSSEPTIAKALDFCSKCKVVKSLKPLVNFRFYLDIEKHNVLLKIESKIKELGGSIEFLLTKDVTHFITDRVLDNKDTSIYSPTASPRTSLSNLSETGSNISVNNDTKGGNKIKSRADAMLQRARKVTTEIERQPSHSRSPSQVARRWGTPIWNTDYTINFFEKVFNAVKDHFKGEFPPKSKEKLGNAKILKGSYIKFEAFNKQYRPYYTLLKGKWPGINLETYEHIGAFKYANDRKSAKSVKATQHTLPESKKSEDSTMTRKNRSTKHIRVQPSSRITSEKQCGFCEICRVEYDVLTVHLKTNEHVNFVKNDRNFMELDSLIKSSANVNKFLTINKTILNGDECEVFPKRSRRQTALNNRYIHHKSQSEPERIKDAVVELEKKSLSETNTLTRYTRQSFSRQSVSLTPASLVNQRTVSEHKSQPNEVVTAVVRSRRESVKKVNYAEPGEDEENSNDVVFSDIQRKPIKPLKKSAVNVDESPDVKPKRPISTVMYKVVDTNTENHNDRKEPLAENNSEQPASLIVKFKKVRQTELSILNGEAVNFMFPPKMSSDVPTDVDRHTTSESRPEHSSDFLTSEKGPYTPKRKSSIASMCTNDSFDSSGEKRQKNNNSFVMPGSNIASQEKLSNSGRDRRGKRHQRRRFRCAPIQSRGRQRIKPEPAEPAEVCAAIEVISSPPEDRMGENQVEEEETCNLESILKNELGKYKFAFERVPYSEPWYGVFNRQDECKEAAFEYYGSTVYRKLPYEMGPLPPLPTNCGCFKSRSEGDKPMEQPSTPVGLDEDSTASTDISSKPESVDNPDKCNQRNVDKEENKELGKKKSTNRMASLLSIDMPRKSPREHPSTLAILSCLLNRREDKPQTARKDEKSDSENPLIEPSSEKPKEELKPASPVKEEKSKEEIQVPKQIENEINTPIKASAKESTNVQISPQIGESVKRLRRGAKLLESKRLQGDSPADKKPATKEKRSVGRPRRPYVFQKSTDSSESDRPEYVDVNRLNRQIDLYLSMSPNQFDFPDDHNLPIVQRKNGIVDHFQYELDLGDLVFDSTAGKNAMNTFNSNTTKSVANKLRLYKIFGVNKKVKVNRTGWPKKRRVITRQINSTRMTFVNEVASEDIANKVETVTNNDLNIISQSPITPPETDVEEKNDCDVNSVTMLRDENTNLTFASDRADNSDMFTVSSDSLDTVLDVGSQIKTEVQKQIIASRKCKVNICSKLPQDVKIRKSSRISFRKGKSSFLPYKLKKIKVEQLEIEDESEAMSCSPHSLTPVDHIKSSSSPAPSRQRSIKASPLTVCPISPRRLRKPRGRWYRER